MTNAEECAEAQEVTLAYLLLMAPTGTQSVVRSPCLAAVQEDGKDSSSVYLDGCVKANSFPLPDCFPEL